MTFTSPSGRTYTWDKPTPPTKEDIDAIVAYDAKQGPQQQQFAPTPYGIGTGMKPSPYLEETTEMALRYGVPAVAAAGTMGASIPLQMAVGLTANVAGEVGARAATRQDLTSPEARQAITKAGVLGMIPGRAGAGVLETAATLGGGSALAEALGAVAGGQELEDKKVSGQVTEAGSFAAAMGGSLGLLSKGLGRISTSAVANAKQQELLREVGIDRQALPQILPQYAPMAERQAASNPVLRETLASTESQITRSLFDSVGNVPTNSELAEKLNPLVQIAEAAETGLKQAKAQQAQAQARLAALEAAPQQTATWQQAYETAALEQLDAVRKQAAATFAAQQGFGIATSITSHADDLTKTLSSLDDAIRGVSSTLYAKSGLDAAQPMVSRDALLRSARSTLKDASTSEIGQSIIAAIENVGKVGDEAPELLSWNQFRELRDLMAQRFADFGTAYKSRAESQASSVYQNLGSVFRRSVQESAGKEGLKAYDAAQKYWRGWTGLRDSDFTSDIFGTTRKLDASGQRVITGITVDKLRGFAEGLLTGDVQAIRGVVDAVDLVGKYSPEAAQTIKASVGRAVRGALVDKYRNSPSDLVMALAEQVGKDDVRPFIQLAGFGTRRSIETLAKAVKKYPKEDITPEVLESALAAGNTFLGLGRGVVQKRAKEAAALAVAGASEKSAQKLASARTAAQTANLSADEANAVYRQTLDNPIFSVFTGRGKHRFTEEAGKTGKGTISEFVMSLSPEDGQRFMGALRQKDPQLAELAGRKILADEFYRISDIDRQAKDATSKVDLDKLRRLFKPTLPQDKQRAEHLRKVIGDTLDGRMKQFFGNLEKVYPTLKEARLITRDQNVPIVSTIAGVAQPFAQVPGVSALGAAAITSRIQRILEKPYFDLLSFMATDPKFLQMALKGESFGKALKSLPMQRAYGYLAVNGLSEDMSALDWEIKRPQQSPAR